MSQLSTFRIAPSVYLTSWCNACRMIFAGCHWTGLANAATKVGSQVSVVVPKPNWPRWLRPQLKSSRLVEIIKQCSMPKATDITLIFILEMGSTAESKLGFQMSSSSAEAFCPYSPWPQSQQEPSFSTAAECIPPQAMSCNWACSPTKPRFSWAFDSLFCHPRSGFPATNICMGVGWSPVFKSSAMELPRPKRPKLPAPQLNTSPVLLKAKEWNRPAAISTMLWFFSSSSSNSRAVSISSSSPCPVYKNPPQLQMRPRVKARLWQTPKATREQLFPIIEATTCGTKKSVSSPCPQRPKDPAPQHQTWPRESMDAECASPTATNLNFASDPSATSLNEIFVGRIAASQAPCPRRPCPPWPQLNMSPGKQLNNIEQWFWASGDWNLEHFLL